MNVKLLSVHFLDAKPLQENSLPFENSFKIHKRTTFQQNIRLCLSTGCLEADTLHRKTYYQVFG